MKKTLLILSAMVISLLSFSQSHIHSGKNDGPAVLFDSGGVGLSVKEYNFDSCGITKRQIYTCEFTFKNDNPYPVILKHYSFYTYNVTDSINNAGCEIKHVSTARPSDTLAAKSSKIIKIAGESTGVYQPTGTPVNKGVTFGWEFNGFTPYKK